MPGTFALARFALHVRVCPDDLCIVQDDESSAGEPRTCGCARPRWCALFTTRVLAFALGPFPGRASNYVFEPVQRPALFARWSSAICARAAATSSALVFACPASPQPPSIASVSSTQVRSESDASLAAAAIRSVN